MKKAFLLVLFLLLSSVGGWYFWQHNQQDAEDPLLTLYGNVDIREAQLAFNASEHIDKMLVEEGDHVKKGQLLATLHMEALQASLEQIDAQIEAQQQNVNKLKAGSRPEEIAQAKALYEAALSNAESTQDTYKRQSGLLNKNLVSEDEVEHIKMLAISAAKNVNVSKQSLNLLIAGPRKEDIAAAVAQLQALKASQKLAQQHLENASLYAPENGIIRNRILQAGEMVFPQTPVFSLALTNPIWVRAYLPETSLGQVPLGAKAKIYTDSYPHKSYSGWVGFISPTAEFTPKNVQTPELRTSLVYAMRVFACNPQDELRLGMPATVTIELGQHPLDTPSASQLCQ